MESLVAAVRCGANAVYLGTKNFNARKSAENFDFETLKKAIQYCHARNVKVYITVNTLVLDSEIQSALDTVYNCLTLGADGFIIQDLGLAELIKKYYPQAKIHASTQCAVNSPDGFKKLEELGFSRAVLPREMTLNEIKEIRKSTDMELEIFVHGALCMCVSGQCYLSSMLGGRSGNRGLCAQPCRLSFSADNSASYDLSLKDLSLISHLEEIEKAGIISLKIEGRMKRPEYVAAAVTACKNAISGNYNVRDEKLLKDVFSRSGFTDGYFTGKRNNMFGTRQKEDVLASGAVLKELSALYNNEKPLIPVNISFVCKENEETSLTLSTDKKTVTVKSLVPEKALNKPLTKESVEERLSKFGGTQYFADTVDITLDSGLNLPAKAINEMRRRAVEELDKFTLPEIKKAKLVLPKTKSAIKTPYFTARFESAKQIPKEHPFERIFIPVYSSDEDFIKTNAGVEIPRGLFGVEEKLKNRLKELKELGVKNALCSNLGAYKTAEDIGFTVYGDFGLNVFNSFTAEKINSPILSFELTVKQANVISANETGIIAYGKLPLMLTRNCPVKNNIGCEKCNKKGALTDRKGYSFPVKCSPYPCVEILNPIPLILSDKMQDVNTDFIHFYFTDETKEDINNIVNMYKNRSNSAANYTRGLYYRGVK